MDNMDDLKVSCTDLTNCPQLQTGIVFVNIRIITNLKLLCSMSKDSIIFSFAYIKV